MKREKLFSTFLSLCLLCALCLFAAAPAAAAEVSDPDALAAALAAGGEVKLTADIAVPADGLLTVPEGVTAALDLAGHSLSGGAPEDGCLIRALGGLTLTDSVGGGALYPAGIGILIGETGDVVMRSGAIADSGYDGVMVLGGAFTLTGGGIHGATGFYHGEDGQFTGGACVEVQGGTFRMTGGELSGAMSGLLMIGGSAEVSGGVMRNMYNHVDYGSMDYYGGLGVEVYGGTATVSGVELRDMAGGGVCAAGDCRVTVDGCSFVHCFNGVIVTDGAALTLSGSPCMEDLGNGVSLEPGAKLQIGETLSPAEPIPIWHRDADRLGADYVPAITEGLGGNTAALTSRYPLWYALETDEKGEAALRYAQCYPDVFAADWYADEVNYAKKYDLLRRDDGLFDPNGTVTGGEVLETVMLFCSGEEPETEMELLFADVPDDAPYLGALKWAVSAGYIVNDTRALEADKPFTREEMAYFCYLLGRSDNMIPADWTPREPDNPDFAECRAPDAWCWLRELGIIHGRDDGRLDPGALLTRAECIAMLCRLSECFWQMYYAQ